MFEGRTPTMMPNAMRSVRLRRAGERLLTTTSNAQLMRPSWRQIRAPSTRKCAAARATIDAREVESKRLNDEARANSEAAAKADLQARIDMIRKARAL